MLMHMGALTTGALQDNLVHVVINNGAHDSVGGQPTQARRLDLARIASACGYGTVARAVGERDILDCLRAALAGSRSAFVEIRCKRGARADLGRPDRAPAANKADFMQFLRSEALE